MNNATWKGVIRQHGDSNNIKNGQVQLQFWATNGPRIANTVFQHQRICKYTCYRDFFEQSSLIDFCIVSADLFSLVTDFKLKQGLYCQLITTSCLHFESNETLEKQDGSSKYKPIS